MDLDHDANLNIMTTLITVLPVKIFKDFRLKIIRKAIEVSTACQFGMQSKN